jgi:hypothetical protein
LSSLLTTPFLALALFAGSVFSAAALAQDSTPGVKPCIGELCPPKAPREDMPVQKTEDVDQSQKVHAPGISSVQARPHKRMRVSVDRDPTRYRRKKATAYRFTFDRYQVEQSNWLNNRQTLSHELR